MGFTLIELILALALSAVLLALLAAALNIGIARATGNRDDVEQARLAGGVITLIASDIQNAAIYDPQDVSSAMSIAEASAKFDVDSIDSISSGAPAGSGGSGSNSSTFGDSSSSFDSTSEAESLRRPLGVYGTLQELQLDVLRENPQFEVNQEGAVSATTATGEISTVLYKLGEGLESLGSSAATNGRSATSGLVRQEVHRDLLNWAEQTGTAADFAGQPLLIAAEVVRLEFRYFDGTEALEEWDSDLREGELPRAIELRIWFREEPTSDST
ncbi:MAG: prepilin-type N-terminal cleavage/methylation domain-containing protein, partial [Aeoliella sp.]